MSEYVYVAIVQQPMAALDDCDGTQICIFLSIVSAQKWVDNILADYEDSARESVNWDIQKHTVK